MNFSQALSRYIGRRIEVFQSAQFLVGTLLGVGDGFFTIEVGPTTYGSPVTQTVLESRTELVRVLP